jgi:hypothetical protein
VKAPCDRDVEIVEMVSAGAWPARADAELMSHVAACSECRELLRVIVALNRTDVTDAASPRLPDARLVWHRAQMEARRESARRAARPVIFAQVAATAVLLLTFVMWADFSRAFDRLASGASRVASGAAEMMAPVRDTLSSGRTILAANDEQHLPLSYVVGGVLGIAVLVLGVATGVSRLADRSGGGQGF